MIDDVSICARRSAVARVKVVFNATYKFDVNSRMSVAVDESSEMRKVPKMLAALHAGYLIVCVHALVCARAGDYFAKDPCMR